MIGLSGLNRSAGAWGKRLLSSGLERGVSMAVSNPRASMAIAGGLGGYWWGDNSPVASAAFGSAAGLAVGSMVGGRLGGSIGRAALGKGYKLKRYNLQAPLQVTAASMALGNMLPAAIAGAAAGAGVSAIGSSFGGMGRAPYGTTFSGMGGRY
jgi:hypothetical protein